MSPESNDSKYPSWKWVLLLVLAITGWLIKEGVSSVNARITNQEVTTAQMQDLTNTLCTRASVLEEAFKDLREDNRDIKLGLKEVVNALNQHEKTTLKALRNKGE